MRTLPSLSFFESLADDIGHRLIGLIAGLYAIGSLCLLLGTSLSVSSALAGLLVGMAVPQLLSTNRSPAGLFATAGLFAMALLAANAFFDGSSDAIGYHKPGVLQFLDGWNPYWNATLHDGISHWTVIYPKASWICGAQLAHLTGRLECGKAINLLGLLAAVFSAWRFLRPRLTSRPRLAIAVAVLIGFNPVSIAQCMTFYVDGLIASLLTILLFDLADITTGKSSRIAWSELALCTLLVSNLKFTGLVYAGIAWSVAGAFIWRAQGFLPARRLGVACVLVFVPAVLLFGKTPYYDNLSSGRHLFYPLLGAESINIMKEMRPARLIDHNRFTRFAIANLSRDARHDGNPAPKWPFQFVPSARHMQDARIAGFGPFYGETFVLSALALIALAMTRRPITGTAGVFMLTALLVTSFCHEDAWWARYSPQMFLFVPFAIVLLARAEGVSPAWPHRCATALLVILAANLAVVAINSMGRSAWITHRLNQDIADMAAVSTKAHPIEINFGQFHPLARTLLERDIPFVETPGSDTTRWTPVYSTQTCFWRPAPTYR